MSVTSARALRTFSIGEGLLIEIVATLTAAGWFRQHLETLDDHQRESRIVESARYFRSVPDAHRRFAQSPNDGFRFFFFFPTARLQQTPPPVA